MTSYFICDTLTSVIELHSKLSTPLFFTPSGFHEGPVCLLTSFFAQSFQLLSFHIHAKPFPRNPFVLILIQMPRGVGIPSLTYSLPSFTKSVHSLLLFCASQNSSSFFSISSAFFTKKWRGCYPYSSQSGTARRTLRLCVIFFRFYGLHAPSVGFGGAFR